MLRWEGDDCCLDVTGDGLGEGLGEGLLAYPLRGERMGDVEGDRRPPFAGDIARSFAALPCDAVGGEPRVGEGTDVTTGEGMPEGAASGEEAAGCLPL
jgi:hypothetical protein